MKEILEHAIESPYQNRSGCTFASHVMPVGVCAAAVEIYACDICCGVCTGNTVPGAAPEDSSLRESFGSTLRGL